MSAARILIVDDNVTNQKLVAYLMKQHGYEVATAADATEALAKIEKTPPALILMDIQLPGVDGLALTKQIKAHAAYRNIIIIALTAYAMKGDQEKALAAGCDDYVTKPIDTRALPGKIAGHLAKGTAPS